MTTKSERIRFSSIISDPEAYIEEMFQLHPEVKHDKESGSIEIKNPIIDSSFRYLLLEEGLFLFAFSSYSPVDAEYNFISNPTSDYFSLVFYFTEEKSKSPLYIRTENQFQSNDQISLFFNGLMTAEIFIKAKQKAYGLRLDIHKTWLEKNLDLKYVKADNKLQNIIDFKTKSFIKMDCNLYKDIVQTLLLDFNKEKTLFQKIVLKIESYKLIIQYLTEIIDQPNVHEKIEFSSNKGELKPALNFLEKHLLHEFPGNKILAEMCTISESSFNKKFKIIFDKSPANYFISLKMKEALRLLQLGENVKTIAHKVGYRDNSAFGRAFKQQFGKSPTAYLKK